MESINLQLIPHTMEDCIYLDHAASTPCLPEVVDAMMPFFTQYPGNPGSISHKAGKSAAKAVKDSRETIASVLAAAPHEIFFTSGATEAINMAIKGIALAAGKGHLITCATEHSAVLQSCRSLESRGFRLTVLPVDENGSITPGTLEAAIAKDTILVAIMHANNETGVIHNLQPVGEICNRYGIPFVCDATQTIGKTPFLPSDFGIDCCCFAAHKFYGPKGIGALYFNTSGKVTRLSPLIDGGAQESGLRSGTLHVAGIVGMAAAFRTLKNHVSAFRLFLENCAYFENRLTAMQGIILNGSSVLRVPGITSASFRFLEGGPLLASLNTRLCVTSGSSCSSGSGRPSHVLTAMGHGQQQAMAGIRFSPGLHSSRADIERALLHIEKCVAQLREESQTWKMFQSGLMKPVPSWFHPQAV
jgi:cysteine desulfurase